MNMIICLIMNNAQHRTTSSSVLTYGPLPSLSGLEVRSRRVTSSLKTFDRITEARPEPN